MATETWIFKDSPYVALYDYSDSKWTINFTCNNVSYSVMEIYHSSYDYLYYGTTLVFDKDDHTGWIDQAYRTVTFETAPSGSLLAFLQANATKQVTPRVSVDLTTLAGWANLSAGAHNITVVAKANGYKDSAPSASVSVTKPVATKTLKAGTYKWIDNPNLSGFPSDASYKTYELIFTSGGASFSYLHCSAYNSDWFGVAYGPLPNRTNFVGYSNNRTEWGYFDDDDNFWHKNVAYQTITLATDQEVSVDFYNWAITEGNLVRESAVGTWLLNTTLTRPSTNQTYTLDVNVAYDKTHTFTAKYMELYDSGYSLKYVLRFEHYEPDIGDTEARNFYYTKDHDYNSGSTSGNYSLYVGMGNIFDRVNEAIRTFTITGGADIYNPDLIAWLKANAVKQS